MEIPMLLGTEAGLLATNAPALWALGYTGYGTKVLIADTGVDPSHPALGNNYQGVYSTESATWFEMDNPGGSPFDCLDHGTHVAGTVLGLDRKENDTIGMAYNAKWLGATILCGLGSIDNIACFQWALDPDNDPSTTEDIPDVINNSWYDPEVTDDCLSPYEQVLKSLEAAGVAVIFSAGNLGPEPGTIAPPHNLNYDLLNSFTVAAVNGNIVHLPVASFSSRGPSSCGGSGSLLIKPEVSAPGVDVRSCVPGGGYGLKSGTSMAAPHVSGAILLLKEAFPQLSGRQLKEALYLSAKDIGPIGEDNLYGNGIIDVLSAFQYLQSAGHIPQDPVKENDVRLLAVNHNEISCSGSFSPQIVFENSGKEAITQLNWNITVNGPMQTEYNGVWTGYILSGETASFVPGDLSLPGGIYKTRYSIDYPNNLPDERPLNNILTGEVRILEKEALSVSSYPKNLPICADSKWIRHDASFNGQGVVRWFDHATNGQLLGEGASLWLDPSIGTGAYAELTHNVNTGRTEPDPTYASQSNTSGEGLRFDVLYPMTLEEITLYVVQKGLFQIIISKDKQVIANKTQLITTTGPVKITLGLYMDIGANYTILLEKGNNLQFDAAAVNYPIVIDDILHIQGPIMEDSEVDAYYYFYDWKVQYADPCGRQYSEVLLTGENGYLDLNIKGPDTLAPGQEGIYTADLSESQLWSWRINNDPSVADSLLIVSIPEESKVQIGLWAVGPFGCVQNTYKDILILEQTSGMTYSDQTFSGWQIYPNPATESLYLSCNSSIENESVPLVHFYNAQGALVHKTTAQRINKSLFHIAPDVPPGFYILTFGPGINQAIFKIAIF